MRQRTLQRRLGLTLMGAALVATMLVAGPAGAQDATEVRPAVQAKALIAYPLNDVIPDTLLKGFPPQVVCVVRPDLCPEELEPVREPIGDVLAEVDGNQQTLPIQPANPDGLTVTYTGGTPRYASAVKVELPEVPEGEEIDEFVLSFPQGQPSFSFSSPAFRRVIMAIVQTAGSQDPEVFQKQMEKALTEEEPLTQPLLAIEACPLTTAIPEDAEAPRAAPISAISEENADGDLQPAVNCLYGSNGVYDEATATWSFDLTIAAKAWADGTLEHHGLLLRPTGSENLAFGDPDTSTNAQVVLDVSEAPRATFASSTPPPPPEPLAPLAPPQDQPTTSAPSSTGTAPTSTSPSSGSFSAPAPTSGSSPATAPPAEVAPPQAAPPAPTQDVALPASQPRTPWTVWLLVLPFAGGMWLTARSLSEELVPTPARAGGALTRLVQARTG